MVAGKLQLMLAALVRSAAVDDHLFMSDADHSPPPPAGSCFGECRRPWYHFTALNLTTSDPNGLQWRRKADGAATASTARAGSVASYELFGLAPAAAAAAEPLSTPGALSYEFFHQDRSSYTKTHPQYCWGTEGAGSAWGHASR